MAAETTVLNHLIERIRAFYEEFESISDLVQRAQRGAFARLLKEQVPFNTRGLISYHHLIRGL